MNDKIDVEAIAADKDIRDFLLAIPNAFDAGDGEILHDGRNTIKTFTWQGSEYAVKRFISRNVIQRLSEQFGIGKAQRSFENACALLRDGITTPGPLGYIIRRYKNGIIRDSYYVCQRISALPICDGLHEFGEYDELLVVAFARFVADLHEKGYVHNDLNGTNVRYKAQGTGFEFSLIDLNRLRHFGNPKLISKNRYFDDLTRFSCVTPMFERFLYEYLKARGWNETLFTQAMDVKSKHDRAYDRKKHIRRFLRNIFKMHTK